MAQVFKSGTQAGNDILDLFPPKPVKSYSQGNARLDIDEAEYAASQSKPKTYGDLVKLIVQSTKLPEKEVTDYYKGMYGGQYNPNWIYKGE